MFLSYVMCGGFNQLHADIGSSHTSGDRPLSPGDNGDHLEGEDLDGQPPRKKVGNKY